MHKASTRTGNCNKRIGEALSCETIDAINSEKATRHSGQVAYCQRLGSRVLDVETLSPQSHC